MLVFTGRDSLQFSNQLALLAVVQRLLGDGNEFFPIVPLANSILDLAQIIHEPRVAAGHSQNVSQFLHLQSVGVKISSIQTMRRCELNGERYGACSRRRSSSA